VNLFQRRNSVASEEGGVPRMLYSHCSKFLKKWIEFNLPTFILFCWLWKRIRQFKPRKVMADFKGGRHTNWILKAMQSLHENSKISLKYNCGKISEPVNTNKGVRLGCGLSPDLFILYIIRAIKNGNKPLKMTFKWPSGKEFKQYYMLMIKL